MYELEKIIREVIEQEKIPNELPHPQKIFSGFHELDKITGGFQNGQLIIIAAQANMGKTAFALNIISHAALEQNKKILLFSFANNAKYFAKRFLHSQLKTDAEVSGLTEQEEKRLQKLSNLIFIEDNAAFSIFDLIENASCTDGVDMIVIDYLQLINGLAHCVEAVTSQYEIIVRLLKILAKSLNIPIILISQLSVSDYGTSFGIKRPLSEVNTAGEITKYADLVLSLFRPEYFGLIEDDKGNSTIGRADIKLEQNGNGKLGEVHIGFDSSAETFRNLPTSNIN